MYTMRWEKFEAAVIMARERRYCAARVRVKPVACEEDPKDGQKRAESGK